MRVLQVKWVACLCSPLPSTQWRWRTAAAPTAAAALPRATPCCRARAGPRRPSHLTVAASPACYLMLPPKGRLVPGHCCIVPTDHLPSIRQARGVCYVVWGGRTSGRRVLCAVFRGGARIRQARARVGLRVLICSTVLGRTRARKTAMFYRAAQSCGPLPFSPERHLSGASLFPCAGGRLCVGRDQELHQVPHPHV